MSMPLCGQQNNAPTPALGALGMNPSGRRDFVNEIKAPRGVTPGAPGGAQRPHEREAESRADPALPAVRLRRGRGPRMRRLWKPEKGGDGAPWGPRGAALPMPGRSPREARVRLLTSRSVRG